MNATLIDVLDEFNFPSAYTEENGFKSIIKNTYKYNSELVIRTESITIHSDPDSTVDMKIVYTKNGSYFCDFETLEANDWMKALTKIEGSIGFNELQQRWYGWSHRATTSFGIASKVSKSSSAYRPISLEDDIQCNIKFADLTGEIFEIGEENPNDNLKNTSYKKVHTHTEMLECLNGYRLHYIFTRFNSDGEIFELENNSCTFPIPESYGRGEWVAETLEDAKQMAKDFVKGVS